jgi:hypothetical protein
VASTFIKRIFLPGLLAAVVMAVLSFAINGWALADEHARYDFFRADDDALRVPGLAITSLLWGLALATAYRLFSGSLAVRRGGMRGATFGFAMFALVAFFHELFVYQFIAFSPAIVIGAELHYLLSYTLGGALIGVLSDR